MWGHLTRTHLHPTTDLYGGSQGNHGWLQIDSFFFFHICTCISPSCVQVPGSVWVSALLWTLVSMVTEGSTSSLMHKCVFGPSAVRTGTNAGRTTSPALPGAKSPPYCITSVRRYSADLSLMRFLSCGMLWSSLLLAKNGDSNSASTLIIWHFNFNYDKMSTKTLFAAPLLISCTFFLTLSSLGCYSNAAIA